jgi:tryptophan synthase alpha chain
VTALSDALAKARANGRAALIGYLPVGYPSVELSIKAMIALVDGGCDVVEVGVPYSDPVMDGPTIQAASEPAVRAGVGMSDALSAVRAVADTGAAAVPMTYWNPVERYGVERFAADLAAAGGSGAITPDLIPDEAAPWITATDDHGLDRVFLLDRPPDHRYCCRLARLRLRDRRDGCDRRARDRGRGCRDIGPAGAHPRAACSGVCRRRRLVR